MAPDSNERNEVKMNYMIGVDAGTSNVKAVIFDEAGRECAAETMENEPIYSDGAHVEMDMNTLWNKTLQCLTKVVARGGVDKAAIAGIGVTAQGEGCWLIDERGRPVQNAILWCDARANEEVRFVRQEQPALGELIFRTTGTPPVTSTQLMQLLWMKKNRKEILDRASTVFFCKDWLRYQLTGVVGTDMTDAGTCYVDVNTGKVSTALLTALGLGGYAARIPEPAASDSVAACLKAEISDALGLPRRTPVIAGSIDVCASCVGTGAIHENDVCIVLGTTCANMIVKSKADCAFGAEGTRYEKYPVGDLYFLLQPTMNGTPNIDWMLGAIADTKDFAAIDRMISSVPVGCGGVVYSPYISVAGERAVLSSIRQGEFLRHEPADEAGNADSRRLRRHSDVDSRLLAGYQARRQDFFGRRRREESGLVADHRRLPGRAGVRNGRERARRQGRSADGRRAARRV